MTRIAAFLQSGSPEWRGFSGSSTITEDASALKLDVLNLDFLQALANGGRRDF